MVIIRRSVDDPEALSCGGAAGYEAVKKRREQCDFGPELLVVRRGFHSVLGIGSRVPDFG
jgi:hypothetical protein